MYQIDQLNVRRFVPAAAFVMLLLPQSSVAEKPLESIDINVANWGAVTAPVYGSSENGVYRDAELFAGPNKFGLYYHGVLPNGRIVKPAGVSVQVGMNPLGTALTPDGRFLVTSNDDERDTSFPSLQSSLITGGYSLTVIDTSTMTVTSHLTAVGKFFVGLQVTGSGPYTVWASGGADQDVKLFTISQSGLIQKGNPASIVIPPITPQDQGYVSHYTPDPAFDTADAKGNKPPVPSGFDRAKGAATTFPAGSALSPDGKYLYVACNGDNSVAVIDTASKQVVRQVAVGYFPYSVALTQDGSKLAVSNWGVTEYKFASPAYDQAGVLKSLAATADNQPAGFYVPVTNTTGQNPKTSSVSILSSPKGDATQLSLMGSVYQGRRLDPLYQVGDTHPSAMAILHFGPLSVLFVTKANSDSLGRIVLASDHRVKIEDLDLSPVEVSGRAHSNDAWGSQDDGEDRGRGLSVHGAYPNALAVSPDQSRIFVAEAGLNSVAVLNTKNPLNPKLIGRIPTGWYPTAVIVSPDGNFLYVVNAKGIGEDINPKADTSGPGNPTGVASWTDPKLGSVDSNYIFGSVQKVDLRTWSPENRSVLANNFAVNTPSDVSVVPAGGAPSKRIKHVFFILHENKTFDSMLGNLSSQFGPYGSLGYINIDGTNYTNKQYTGVSVNTQLLAQKFATAVNYYSDSEESDAGHQFAASGTATDYTEKTLLVKSGRGLLVSKNFEAEDYPEAGYIFNNAARNGVSFKDYGAMIRIVGTDTGTSTPTTLNDPLSGDAGLPALQADKFSVSNPLTNIGDVQKPTKGLGQSYFLALPVVSVLGTNNLNGEPRLDRNYPGYNFNISDQRRAQEFIADFDRMVAQGTLPRFIYIYQPNDHTGGVQAPNASSFNSTALQEIADGDVALGMVVRHIMESPAYYDAATREGSAIFITYDDAQSSLDHIHPHRTPLIVVSPYAKPAYAGKKHYSTASIVKTEELLLGLPPNNLGDLFATDLRDLFQPSYNGIKAADVPVSKPALAVSAESVRIWSLANRLDASAPDRDSKRLGALARLTIAADELRENAEREGKLNSRKYKRTQGKLYRDAVRLVNTGAPKRDDDDL